MRGRSQPRKQALSYFSLKTGRRKEDLFLLLSLTRHPCPLRSRKIQNLRRKLHYEQITVPPPATRFAIRNVYKFIISHATLSSRFSSFHPLAREETTTTHFCVRRGGRQDMLLLFFFFLLYSLGEEGGERSSRSPFSLVSVAYRFMITANSPLAVPLNSIYLRRTSANSDASSNGVPATGLRLAKPTLFWALGKQCR